jgi:hypothetical protein
VSAHCAARPQSRPAATRPQLARVCLAVAQVLTVGTHNGYLHCFVASLPVVYDFHGSRVLYLTSLLEVRRSPGLGWGSKRQLWAAAAGSVARAFR